MHRSLKKKTFYISENQMKKCLYTISLNYKFSGLQLIPIETALFKEKLRNDFFKKTCQLVITNGLFYFRFMYYLFL